MNAKRFNPLRRWRAYKRFCSELNTLSLLFSLGVSKRVLDHSLKRACWLDNVLKKRPPFKGHPNR